MNVRMKITRGKERRLNELERARRRLADERQKLLEDVLGNSGIVRRGEQRQQDQAAMAEAERSKLEGQYVAKATRKDTASAQERLKGQVAKSEYKEKHRQLMEAHAEQTGEKPNAQIKKKLLNDAKEWWVAKEIKAKTDAAISDFRKRNPVETDFDAAIKQANKRAEQRRRAEEEEKQQKERMKKVRRSPSVACNRPPDVSTALTRPKRFRNRRPTKERSERRRHA